MGLWDRVNPSTGQLEEARLDIATRDAVTVRTMRRTRTTPQHHADPAASSNTAAASIVRGSSNMARATSGEKVNVWGGERESIGSVTSLRVARSAQRERESSGKCARTSTPNDARPAMDSTSRIDATRYLGS